MYTIYNREYKQIYHESRQESEENTNNHVGSKTKCEICDKSFSNPQNLRRHKIKIHQIEFKSNF